jgi:DUF438 domain-containing protein
MGDTRHQDLKICFYGSTLYNRGLSMLMRGGTSHMPLKRHPALQDLSRDHHLFLLEARHVRWFLEGDERAKSLSELIESVLAFWELDGKLHLQEEEEIVYPIYLANAPLKKRDIDALYTDHTWLREKLQELADLPRLESSSSLLRSISEYVVNHVRQEERVIYMAIQDTLSEEQLQAIAEKSLAFRKEHRKPRAIGRAQDHINLPDIED